jgi:hypothetical protein
MKGFVIPYNEKTAAYYNYRANWIRQEAAKQKRPHPTSGKQEVMVVDKS